jgi:catechol 2,3-dioxygenase
MSPVAATGSLPSATQIGCVHLRVAAIDTAVKFYAGLLGMHVRKSDAGSATLGTELRPLVELTELPGAARQPVRASGLYHTAFLLPNRAGLGHMLRRVAQARWPLDGASDHAVSEALYLSDPDGNGVEIYADRARDSWPRVGGQVAMTTLPLDINNLVDTADAESAAGVVWRGFPAESVVGHVHLRVSSIAAARALYVDTVGLDITADNYPGALFMSAGGYHHHVAANIWGGSDAPPLRADTAGLIAFELIVPDTGAIEAIRLRALESEIPVEQVQNGIALTYAGGIRTLVVTRSVAE